MTAAPKATLAAAQEGSAAQLDAIEKKIEKDQFGDEMYAQLDSIITKEPTNFRAHLYLGNCYAKLGLPDQAIEEFKLATKHGPNEPKAYVELVKQQIKLGQIPAAMELLDEAGRKFPNDPEVQFWIGNSLLKKGRFPEAEVAYKLAIAKKLGATHIIKADDSGLQEKLRALTGGRGVDAAFEVVGIPQTVKTAIESVRKGGSVTLVGNLKPQVDLPLQAVVTRELTLIGTCSSCGEYPECLELIASGKINVTEFISATPPLAEGAAWFERLYAGEKGLMKVLLKP